MYSITLIDVTLYIKSEDMISLKSKLTQKVLAFIFLQDEEFYASALAKRLKLDRGNLIRKLHELETVGLLSSKVKGHEKYYKLNSNFSFIKEYRSIVQKTFGLEEKIKSIVNKLNGIERAFLFGSYVKNKMDEKSDIDLMVIGKHSTIELQKQITKLQKDFDREINVISIGNAELKEKQKKDPFIRSILKSPRIELV